jgi:UDP-N-acetylglucosamine 4,6-dehydratase
MQGGEIFVPKIPSMRIVDVAKAMAPEIEHEIIGIRPGEKLHEVMIPEDDARTTCELDDYYVIQPSFAGWGNRRANGSRAVADGFRYASDSNPEWLDADRFRAMLEAAKA